MTKKILGPYTARVESEHDGDTFKVTLFWDLGFGIKAQFEIDCRLTAAAIGVDAPELRTPAGKDALAFVNKVMPVGSIITVFSHDWDKYGGRFDGEVILADGTELADLLVKNGYAEYKVY